MEDAQGERRGEGCFHQSVAFWALHACMLVVSVLLFGNENKEGERVCSVFFLCGGGMFWRMRHCKCCQR